MGGDSPHKRKRALDDLGDREQKKVQTEDRRLGIDVLHMDVGEKYLLCRTRKASLHIVHSTRSILYFVARARIFAVQLSYSSSTGESILARVFSFVQRLG